MTFLLPLEMFAEFAGTVVSPFCSLLFWPISRLVRLVCRELLTQSQPIFVSFVTPSAAPMSLFQGHFASVSKFSQTAPEESGSKQV